MFTPDIRLVQYRRGGGFTLTELLIALVIVGVLAAFAIPSFNTFVAQQRIKTASFDFMSMITFARSEAIKRNASVTLNVDPALNALTVTTASVATPLKQQEMFTGIQLACVDITATPHAYVNCAGAGIVYNSNGRLDSAFGPLEIYSAATDASSKRCITIDLSGRPNSKKGAC